MMPYDRRGFIELVEQKVLQAVANGPRPMLSIIGAVDEAESTVRRAASILMARGELIDCGMASAYGYAMRGLNTRAYGLPSVAVAQADDLDEIEQVQLRPRSKSGSGVIAPPPYATGYRWGNV